MFEAAIDTTRMKRRDYTVIDLFRILGLEPEPSRSRVFELSFGKAKRLRKAETRKRRYEETRRRELKETREQGHKNRGNAETSK